MRKIIYSIIFISICLFGVGCKEVEKEESNMSEDDLYDIYLLFKAPIATKKYDLSKVIRVVVTQNDSSQDETIALDVQGNGIYINPSISSLGIRATKGTKQIDDMEKAIDILEKYDVQDWEEDYSFEESSSYTDGFGWGLWLQFEDGTVERYKGSGSFAEEITPENFNDFFRELNDFVNERLEEDD